MKKHWLCRWGFHDWFYSQFIDAAGVSDQRECLREGCKKHEWLWK